MGQSWRIELVRSGGVAGMRRRWSLDSDDLSAGETAEVERLLARLDDVPVQPPQPARGADRFQYELRVTRGDQMRTVTLREDAIPPAIRPLIDRLTSRPRTS
jgi:hypothetical protein